MQRLGADLFIIGVFGVKPAKIVMSGVELRYVNEETGRSHVAVRDLNLQVREEEFLSVVGPSGCGKSTLISAIGGFMAPVAGTIALDGNTIRGPGADRGVVFQEYALLPWKNVIDNVALGLKYKGKSRSERYEIARAFLAVARLSDVAEKYPHELSGGMRQRVAVIRTMANTPEVMLMDEPFAAVDAQTRMTLQEELLRVWTQHRITVLFVTHNVDEAVFLGDRVAVFSQGPGKIIEVVDVNIPRSQRLWSVIGENPNFSRLRDHILHLVRGETAEDLT